MSRPIEFSLGEFYHVYNRGTDKREVFLSPNDYERFIVLLYLCNSTESVHIRPTGKNLSDVLKNKPSEKLVDIGAYCLMPNHFHILVRERAEGGLSQFMHKLATSYTMYFNKKNNRSGALFQGVFKARHIDSDNYLKYLFAYIHLNPVKLLQSNWEKTGIQDISVTEKFLQDYRYSSFQEYTNMSRPEKVILEKESFPNYFENKKNFETMIRFWLDFSTDFSSSNKNL